jgi:hypothetical protein
MFRRQYVKFHKLLWSPLLSISLRHFWISSAQTFPNSVHSVWSRNLYIIRFQKQWNAGKGGNREREASSTNLHVYCAPYKFASSSALCQVHQHITRKWNKRQKRNVTTTLLVILSRTNGNINYFYRWIERSQAVPHCTSPSTRTLVV